MDFDPGELYDDSFEDSLENSDYTEDAVDGTEFDPELNIEEIDDAKEEPQEEDTIEYDDDGNPVYLAAAAGFGYHMAQDDLEERKLAEGILDRRDQKKDAPIKVSLSQRHQKDKKKGYMTPFARWSTKANQNPKAAKEGIEYTMEEQLKIIRAQYEE